MIVFHHNDNDGRCAAAIVSKWHTERAKTLKVDDPKAQISFVEMDYRMEPPIHLIDKYAEVVIVDFSFKPEAMKKVFEITPHVTWCDHHATAKAYEEQYGRPVEGYRDFTDKGLSGCECTWRHFFPDDYMPPAIVTLGDYDSWRMKQRPTCLEFNEGLKLTDTNPWSWVWEYLLSDPEDEGATFMQIVESGRLAMKYRDMYCEGLKESYGYTTMIDGHLAFALNVSRFGSQAFGNLTKKYPVCIAYIHDGRRYEVSLYSDMGVDVSEIAKKFGGGGHKGAAGFTSDHIVWTIISEAEYPMEKSHD